MTVCKWLSVSVSGCKINATSTATQIDSRFWEFLSFALLYYVSRTLTRAGVLLHKRLSMISTTQLFSTLDYFFYALHEDSFTSTGTILLEFIIEFVKFWSLSRSTASTMYDTQKDPEQNTNVHCTHRWQFPTLPCGSHQVFKHKHI